MGHPYSVRNSIGLLAAPTLVAAAASDVELDAVADDIAGDVAAYGLHQTLNRGGAELADVPALDADRVVMVTDAGEAVPGGAVYKVQPAYYADLYEELDSPEDSRPAHPGQLIADLLGGETFLLTI